MSIGNAIKVLQIKTRRVNGFSAEGHWVYELSPTSPGRARLGEQVEEHVLLGCHGQPWAKTSLDSCFARLRDRARVDPSCKLYGTRHAYGTNAILNGVNLKVVAELMGHTSTKMTEHYVHLAGLTEHLHTALEQAMQPRQAKKNDHGPAGANGTPDAKGPV